MTLAPPLLSGSIQDKASCVVDMTATPTERGGDGARVAVMPANGATRACVVDDRHDDQPHGVQATTKTRTRWWSTSKRQQQNCSKDYAPC